MKPIKSCVNCQFSSWDPVKTDIPFLKLEKRNCNHPRLLHPVDGRPVFSAVQARNFGMICGPEGLLFKSIPPVITIRDEACDPFEVITNVIRN